jgi:hypothetical protein
MRSDMITIYKGDADTLTETITGLSSLAGYSAKLYVYNLSRTLVDTFTGTPSGLTITYQILNEDTKNYTVGVYNFETKIWDSSDHVYTPTKGKFLVRNPLVSDPS